MPTLMDMRRSPEFDSSLAAGKFTTLPQLERGRGAGLNPRGRFEAETREFVDDGWESLSDLPRLKTTIFEESPKSIIARNDSPDISFDRSVNPYRGCEHGCFYCYARPTHAYMGLSPGLDFESKLFVKPNAAALLREEFTAPSYKPRTLALGSNTDPYQPIERDYRLTRQILEVALEFRHPVGIVTKSAVVTRDMDILKPMAELGLVKVAVSVTTLDGRLARAMEPRASTPTRRIDALRQLADNGIPTVVMLGPIIPAINDMEIESILKAAHGAGVREAGYTMIRLPHEVKAIFRDWLQREMPERAQKVLAQVRDVHGGKDNETAFGRRHTGSGPYAWTIGRRFQMACQRLGINAVRAKLRDDLFLRPPQPGEQLTLF